MIHSSLSLFVKKEEFGTEKRKIYIRFYISDLTMISKQQPDDYELFNADETGKEKNMRISLVKYLVARQQLSLCSILCCRLTMMIMVKMRSLC